MRENYIKCTNCGYDILAEDALLKHAEEKYKLEADKKDAEQARMYNKQKELLEKEKLEFEEKKTSEETQSKKRIKDTLLQEKAKIRKEATEEAEEKIKQLEKENIEKNKECSELLQREASLIEREKKLLDAQEEAEIVLQKKLLEETERIENETKKKEYERYELLIKGYDKKIADQKQTIEDLKKKAEKALIREEEPEFSIEEMLRNEFPADGFGPADKEIKDDRLLHTIMNEDKLVCGHIIYTSRHSKIFDDSWLKLSVTDMQDTGTALSVIVTNAFPKEMSRFGNIGGVWISKYADLKNVVFILREMLIRESAARNTAQGKDIKSEKMDGYLSGDDFRNRIESIVSGFTTLKEQIDKEKYAMQNIWVQRENQIGIAVENTIEMYGTIKGIGGKSVIGIPALELQGQKDKENK
jgi:hypothetical protein